MSIRVVDNSFLRLETKDESRDIPLAAVKDTVAFEGRVWVMCEEDSYTFKCSPCTWDHHSLAGVKHRNNTCTGDVGGRYFVGDDKHGALIDTCEIVCIQRLSRFSTTFDVVWLDINEPHAFIVTHVSDDKDDVLKNVQARGQHIFDLGPDPYLWSRAIQSAREEGWELEDWLYVFGDDSSEEEDPDDGDWEPPAKRARASSPESDSDDEAYAI